MRVTYTGSPRGLAMLRAGLDEAGLTYSYDPPLEQRNAGEVVVQVVIWIGEQAAGEAVSLGIGAALHAAVQKAREKNPAAKIDVDVDAEPKG